jgi:5-(carboxyamino)imidazole ribonucleotide synthase
MLKVGILGGGQLGRMLLQAAANYPVETHLMEEDPGCPGAHLCHHFTKGDIRDFDQVCRFGQGLDAICIEIESVNTEALEQLEKEGLQIYPRPSALKTIKNKITQKQFYTAHGVPTAAYVVTENKGELMEHADFLPAVHKLGQGGYDGRGVQAIHAATDMDKGFDLPGILEKMVNIDKEISQIIAIGNKGEMALYPPVDMIFDPYLHLLDYQISPADLPEKTLWKIEAVALRVVKELKSPGLFAIEMFVDKQGEVYVNETAPRVHNSGHHTIEGNYSSQFDMLWRVILGYPLGNTAAIQPAAIVNILGAAGHAGDARYEGLPEVLKIEGVFVHIYGKKQTAAGRKMGHVTILGKDRHDLVRKAHQVKQLLKVTGNPLP